MYENLCSNSVSGVDVELTMLTVVTLHRRAFDFFYTTVH
jgi:hypothetical protein